jgi:hypothetical protein
MSAEDAYVTESGRVLTDRDFERLADEAENDPGIRRAVRGVVEGLERDGKIVRDGDGYRVP